WGNIRFPTAVPIQTTPQHTNLRRSHVCEGWPSVRQFRCDTHELARWHPCCGCCDGLGQRWLLATSFQTNKRRGQDRAGDKLPQAHPNRLRATALEEKWEP